MYRRTRRCYLVRLLCCYLVAALPLLLAACTNDDTADSAATSLSIDVTQQPWQTEDISVTRSGEILTALQASGFGLYSEDLGISNEHVTWSDTKWSLEHTLIWPKTHPNDFYAYAPYDNTFGTSINTTSKELTFPYYGGYTTIYDVLFASQENVQPGQKVELHFQHALAKLKWGTVTDYSGTVLTVSAVTLQATGLYTNAVVNLADGTVTGTGAASLSITDFKDTPIYVVPQAGVTLTFTLTYSTETLTDQILNMDKTVSLERGKEYTFNLTIGKNHEVVIED